MEENLKSCITCFVTLILSILIQEQNKKNNYMGAIIVKWTNDDKGLNHKWAFFEHFDFFIQ
jgi:hypothetical protein